MKEREMQLLNFGLSSTVLDSNKRFICSENELKLLEWNGFKREYFTTYFKKGRIYIRYTNWIDSKKYKNAYKIERESMVNFVPELPTEEKYDIFIKFHKAVVNYNDLVREPVSFEEFKELEEIWNEKFLLKGDE